MAEAICISCKRVHLTGSEMQEMIQSEAFQIWESRRHARDVANWFCAFALLLKQQGRFPSDEEVRPVAERIAFVNKETDAREDWHAAEKIVHFAYGNEQCPVALAWARR